jgi:hypothetical protein
LISAKQSSRHEPNAAHEKAAQDDSNQARGRPDRDDWAGLRLLTERTLDSMKLVHRFE